jgi:hypothetical protein
VQWLLSVHSSTALAGAAASRGVDAGSCESAAVLLQQLAASTSLAAADRTALLAAALQLHFALVWQQQQHSESSNDSSDVLRSLEYAVNVTTATATALQNGDDVSAARTVSKQSYTHLRAL